MEAIIILAEAVTTHPDGTFSMLRGGITHAWGKKPVLLSGELFVRFAADLSEAGPHEWTICAVDADGGHIMPQVTGSFQVPAEGGNGHFVMKFNCKFPKYEQYSFRVTIDKQLVKSWGLVVREAESKPGPVPDNEEGD